LHFQQLFSGNNQYYQMSGTIDVPLSAGQTFYIYFSATAAGSIGMVNADPWSYITVVKS
jgi:hypothetical protein